MLNTDSKRFIRFVFVGFLNTSIGYLLFMLLALTDLSTWLVLSTSALMSVIFNFFTTGRLVFRDFDVSKLPRFIISYGVIFFIYLAVLEWLSPKVDGRIWAMTIIVIPMALFTYFVQSRFVYNNL